LPDDIHALKSDWEGELERIAEGSGTGRVTLDIQ